MAIMTCPRCGGTGCIWQTSEPGTLTAVTQSQTLCPSCGGKGFVTDGQVQTDGTSNTNVTWVNPIVTRETERIGRIIDLIEAIWWRFPDWRLGQLLVNVVPELEKNLFYTEDTIVEERLNKFNAGDESGHQE